MTESDRADDIADDRDSALDQAAHLRRRLEALAGDIAESEDTLARVYEESARLRPHAAERLREGARRARLYADRERRVSQDGWTPEAPTEPPAGG